MTYTLRYALNAGSGLVVDLNALIASRMLVQANSGAYIQRLKARRLVTVESNGVRAADLLFE